MKRKFLWGSAFSGPQTEGKGQGKSLSTWDYWFQKEPQKFYHQLETSNDFINQYKTDIKLAKDVNFNSLRTSIQWTFLMPNGKDVNPAAVKFYNNMIDEMLQQGIVPIINLFHFDMPMWLMDQGGWTTKASIDAFLHYATTCFQLFGDRVKTWMTFNEPIVHVECQYLYQYHYPCIESIPQALQAMWNTIIAHKVVVKKYHELNLGGEIGIILNLKLPKPRSQSVEDLQAANWADIWQSRCFLDACLKGQFPEELISESKKRNWTWKTTPAEWTLLKNYPIDLLGLNYYQPLRVQAPTKLITKDLPDQLFYNDYQKPGIKINKSRGWEIYPEGIYEALMHIKNNYNNIPVYIAENGTGIEGEEKFVNQKTKMIEDDYRIEFLGDHIAAVERAIKDGSNCFGFHMWTYIDNWSWLNSYKNRYGIVSLNINNGQRTLKKSYYWLRDFIANKEL